MIVHRPITSEDHVADLSKIGKGAGITLLGFLGGRGVMFVLTFFLAKSLGPNDLGVYFLGITIIGFLTVLAPLGTDVGVVRFVAIYVSRNDISRAKGTILTAAGLTLAVSFIIILFTWLLADFVGSKVFHERALSATLKLLVLATPLDSLMNVFLGGTRGFKLMQYSAYTKNLFWIGSRFVLAILLIWVFGMGLQGAILAYLGSSVLSATVALYYLNKLLPLNDFSIHPRFEPRGLVKFSVPMVFSTVIHNLMRQTDVLMIGVFLSATQVGAYSVAVRLIIVAEVFFMAFQPIFHPFVAELHDLKEFKRLSNLLKVLTHWGVAASFPIFLCLLAFPTFFLRFFGKGFLQAASCLSVLALAHIFSSLSSLPNAMIFMSGRSDITLKNNTALLVTNVALNYLLIPKLGILGAAMGTGISLLVIALIRIIEVYQLMKVHPFRLYLLKPVGAGSIALATTVFFHKTLLHDGNVFVTGTLLAGFLLLYILLLCLFKLNKEDLYIKDVIRSKFMTAVK
jgi:O-antigen/teichoic acid export membrane protein